MNKLIAGGIYKIEVPKITPSVHTSNKDWDEEFCKLRQVESVQQKKQFTKTIAQYLYMKFRQPSMTCSQQEKYG